MGEGSSPSRTAAWYVVATRDGSVGRWSLRVSMTLDADGGVREDHHPRAIDDACDLLQRWHARLGWDES